MFCVDMIVSICKCQYCVFHEVLMKNFVSLKKMAAVEVVLVQECMVPLFKILYVGYGNQSVLSLNVNVCYKSKMQHNASLCILNFFSNPL